ncbi:MAG TPA: type II secretion system F family protein [Chthonomonadaceae bacterium]|nr:type II secretion system F family protein [Chthonomonadaceae bacterium]
MMNFFYEAVDETGKTVLGKIDAVDAADVQRRLLQMGYRPQSIAPNLGAAPTNVPAVQNQASLNGASEMPLLTGNAPPVGQQLTMKQGAVRTGSITLAGNAARVVGKQTRSALTQARSLQTPAPAVPATPLGGVKTRDLLLFFQQLASLVRSGMTLYTALENLAQRTPNRNLARTAREMAEVAHTGGRISDVMAQYPGIFEAHIIGIIRAGEMGGFLDTALAEIADDYQKNISLYRATWLPKLLATQALFTLALAQPVFPNLFPNFDVRRYLALVLFRNLPIALAVYWGIRLGSRLLQKPQNRRLRDSWALRLKPFGELQRQTALANFLVALRRLYAAGVSPIQAWEGAMNTASNAVLREELAQAYALMQQGASLPEAFAATGLFANEVEQLILTGHQSGEVVEMLDRAAEYYHLRAEEAASQARFMMLRYGILALLVLGGITSIWLTYSYFHGIFDWVDKFFAPEAGG